MDYIATSKSPGPLFFIFILAYTAFMYLMIAPLVAWSRDKDEGELLDTEQANNAAAAQHIEIEGRSKPHPSKGNANVKNPSSIGSHGPTNAADSSLSKQLSIRSGRSGFGKLLLGIDKVVASQYPDEDTEQRCKSVLSRPATLKSNADGSRVPSAATTSRIETAPNQRRKALSSRVLDVGGRRWKNRRPIGRVDVIQNAVSHEREASALSGLSSPSHKPSSHSSRSLAVSRRRPVSKGMSDVASSMLEDQSHEMMRPSGLFLHRGPSAIHHRARFIRRPSRTGSYGTPSEKSMERSIMSLIEDDISPNDAADANDPGRGNIFTSTGGNVQNGTAPIDSGLRLGYISSFVEFMLDLSAPCEEMKRVVQSALPLTIGAISESLYRMITASFISQYLGIESMLAYLLVGLFVRLTSEELSGAIIDAVSSFIQSCLSSGTVEGNGAREAGQFVQHAMVLQLGFGIPLLVLWTLMMEDFVLWLIRSSAVASLASDYARVVVVSYLVQALSRTFTVVFHISGREHFESTIDFVTATMQVIVVACIVALVEEANLTTVAYVQVLFGVAGSIAKVTYPVMKGWLKPFRVGMFGEIALVVNRGALRQLIRAAMPLLVGTLLEYGEWEVLTLCLRYLGPAEVASWAMLGMIWDILEALTEGIGEAAATQVAFLLAALQPDRARKLAKTAIYLAVVQSLLVTAGFYISGKYLIVLFTTDPTLQHLLNDTVALIGLANMTMSFSQISWSLIGAQGLFRLATSVMFFARWAVTIPIAMIAIFGFSFDPNAVSGALVVGYATASFVLTVIVLRSDWERVARVMQEINAPSIEKPVVIVSREKGNEDAVDPFADFDDGSDSSDGFGFGVDDVGESDN